MTLDDPMMARLNEIAVTAATVDRDQARQEYLEIVENLGPAGDPLHLMTVLHHLADLYDDPAQALDWDLQALTAAGRLTDERLEQYHPGLKRAMMFPSLHLNIADNLAKTGRTEEAVAHLTAAERHLDQLGDDGYGAMIRGGITRLREQLT